MKKSLVSLSLALVSMTAFADSLPTDPNAKLTAGVLATFGSNGYAVDDNVSAVPLVLYDNNRLYAEGAEFGALPYKDDKNWLKVGVTYDGTNFNPKDANTPALRLLDERKVSVNAHVSYMHITPVGGFEVKAMTDVLGRSSGQKITLAHRSKFELLDDKLTLYPKFGVTWQSDKYNEYYYGVSADESVRSGVQQYTIKDSVAPFVGVGAKYQINEQWGLFGNQHAQWLSSSQQDSPLTDDKVNVSTHLGLTYTF